MIGRRRRYRRVGLLDEKGYSATIPERVLHNLTYRAGGILPHKSWARCSVGTRATALP